MMRVLVCGGRDYRDEPHVYATLDRWLNSYGDDLRLCCGYDPRDKKYQGADHLAYQWGLSRFVNCVPFPADWKKHGKAAGPIRNQQQLDEFEPHRVVAFPGGRGTADMCRRAKGAGLSVQYA
jgi:hypothetical protein